MALVIRAGLEFSGDRLVDLRTAEELTGLSYARLWQLVKSGAIARYPNPSGRGQTRIWMKESDLVGLGPLAATRPHHGAQFREGQAAA